MPIPSPMPSPPTLRTSSVSKPQRRRHHHVNIPPSNGSAYSAPPSSKFSWCLKKITQILLLRSHGSGSTSSDLTEENLQEHNKRQAMILAENDKCSPYYKGLTDQSLAVKIGRPNYRIIQDSLGSPGRESHATAVTAHTSFTSLSGIVFKVKELSACFDTSNSISTSSSSTSINYRRKNKASGTTTATVTRTRTMTTTTSLMEDQKKSRRSFSKEKLLRERVSEEAQPTTDNNNNSKPVPVLMPSSNTGSVSGLETSSSIAEVKNNLQTEADKNNKGFMNKDDEKDGGGGDKGLEKAFESLWASKYRPKALKDFICNRDKAMSLQGMIKDGDCGHFIFQGPPGVGKRTMVWAMLRETFGAEKVQAREEHKIFELKGETRSTIEVTVKESPQHVEVSVSELKGYEKHIIVELIKETDSKLSKKGLQNPLKNSQCQAIILHEAEKLSTDALLYIKWLLERYKHTKMFFCCTDASKLQPIRNLCTPVQLSLPSKMEIVEVLEFVAMKEGINLPNQLANKIADSAKNNLRQAIRSFEATTRVSYPFKEDQTILSGWEDDIAMIAKKIIEEQSPKQLYKIRRKLQILFEHDVSSGFIFKHLVEELKTHLDEALQSQVECLYAEYKCDELNKFPNHHLRHTRYPAVEMDKTIESEKSTFQHFMRIEEFIARFMSCYKSSMANRNENIVAS